MKILIVDDEPDMTEMLGVALTNQGYEVETASNGLEALEKASVLAPDAIFMDLMLPDLDGTAVCEILQKWPSTAAIPIIMLTACATDASKLISMHAGAVDFITKPFSYRDLAVRLRRILEEHKAKLVIP